jgi:hypothetical protein
MPHQWFCRIQDEEVGPLTPGDVRRLIHEKSITRDTQIRRDDRSDFIAAGLVKGLFPPLAEDAETSGWKQELGIADGQGLFREDPPTAALRRAKGTAAFNQQMRKRRPG